MEITNKDVKVLGRVAAITTEGIVASAEQVFDDQYGDSGEFQNVINQNFTDTQQSIKDQLTDLTKHHTEDILAVNQRIQTEVFPAISDVNNKLIGHTSDKNNPHSVTKAQVGLSNVDNTSDANKPISTAQQNKFDEVISDYTEKISDESTARSNADKQLQSNIDDLTTQHTSDVNAINQTMSNTKTEITNAYTKADEKLSDKIDSVANSQSEQLQAHISDTGNPHEVTKSQVGLGNVTNDAQVKRSEMGAANGVAQLGDDGKVPSSQLPSYVDDVLEYDNLTSFPQTGESGKIYVSKDTNLTYRWTGSTYVEISQSLALGETSSTAYAGDKGAVNRAAINSLPSSIISDVVISNITGTSVGLNIDKVNKSGLNYGIPSKSRLNIPAATGTAAGLMTAADKAKLDGVPYDTITEWDDIINHIFWDSSSESFMYDTIGDADNEFPIQQVKNTGTIPGLMSVSDKTKLDAVEAGATADEALTEEEILSVLV